MKIASCLDRKFPVETIFFPIKVFSRNLPHSAIMKSACEDSLSINADPCSSWLLSALGSGNSAETNARAKKNRIIAPIFALMNSYRTQDFKRLDG